MPQHVLDDQLDVLDEQVAEPGDLLGREVVAGQHLAQVRVEVANGDGELGVLQEQRGDLLGQHLPGPPRAPRTRIVLLGRDRARQRLAELGDTALDGGQQFARDLAGALRHPQQFVGVPLDPHGQLADLVADAALLELGDAGRDRLAPPENQVPPVE